MPNLLIQSLMERITLRQVVPQVFASEPPRPSDVWRTDLTLERGRAYLVDADSGLGKSSLCSYIYGYRGDYEGEITFDGVDIRRLTRGQWTEIRVRSLSMLWQELRLFPELTALENVLIRDHLAPTFGRARVLELFKQLGIADRAHTPAGRMSLGQQQRLSLVRCLCQPFDFLLLDEPISHLDETNAEIVARLITEEVQARGAGVLVTSVGAELPLAYDQVLKL